VLEVLLQLLYVVTGWKRCSCRSYGVKLLAEAVQKVSQSG